MMGFPQEDAPTLLPLVEQQTRNPDPAVVQGSMDAMIVGILGPNDRECFLGARGLQSTITWSIAKL